MPKDNYSTGYLFSKILQCDNLEDFKQEILLGLTSQREAWKIKINAIMEEKGYTTASLAESCGVSRVAVRKWCDGSLPQSREMFLRIGFAAGYNLTEMNLFLQRHGRYPALYSKSLEDSVYIFVLNSERIPHTFANCQRLFAELSKRLDQKDESRTDASKKDEWETDRADGQDNASVYDTVYMLEGLIGLETEAEMLKFAEENLSAYKLAYNGFYEFVKDFLIKNSMDAVTGKTISAHALAQSQGWSSSLRKCVSQILSKKWFPLRRKVIALGLYLNMDLEELNHLLVLAKMEPLYAKNPVEGAIIYGMEDAKLNDLIYPDGSNELCTYVAKILTDLELPEAAFLLQEL